MNQPFGALQPPQPGSSKPGIVPLRPLTIGEIMSAAIVVVRGHFLVLGPIAALASLLSGLTEWAILAASGSVDEFNTWSTNIFEGGTVPAIVLVASLASLSVSVLTGVALSGVAAVFAAQDTMGAPASAQAFRERMTGRWPVLLGMAVVVGVGVTVGFALLIVPGILLYVAWSVSAPAAVMERSDIKIALRRSVLLTSGSRGRILAITLVTLATSFVLGALLSVMLVNVAGGFSADGAMLASVAISALVAAFTSGWAGRGHRDVFRRPAGSGKRAWATRSPQPGNPEI